MIHEGGKEKNTNVWGRLGFIIISGRNTYKYQDTQKCEVL
jgi:hypothetical protein